MEGYLDQQTPYIQAIRACYPGFTIKTARLLSQQGQFNNVLLVNEDTIFRFPKTPREAAKLTIETALLRNLQERVTLPIPNPLYQSQEGASIGQVFMGFHLLPGEPLMPETLQALSSEGHRQHIAEQLAEFLHQLHAMPVDAVSVTLPAFQGCEEWKDLYNRFHDRLFPFMRPDARRQVTKHFDDFFGDARNCNYAPALIHGDFGTGNILIDASANCISGIIDFSSAQWGDPAVDVAAILAPVSFGEAFLDRFAVVYPGITEFFTRARFYAGTFALQEALFGLEDQDDKAFERGIAQYR
jgi:aminoglycoside 2''-phosphotransferase